MTWVSQSTIMCTLQCTCGRAGDPLARALATLASRSAAPRNSSPARLANAYTKWESLSRPVLQEGVTTVGCPTGPPRTRPRGSPRTTILDDGRILLLSAAAPQTDRPLRCPLRNGRCATALTGAGHAPTHR